jgi:hypothetical protein
VAEALQPRDTDKSSQALSPRERMERLARASRAVQQPAALRSGWARPEEESDDAQAAPAPTRGKVVAPPND